MRVVFGVNVYVLHQYILANLAGEQFIQSVGDWHLHLDLLLDFVQFVEWILVLAV